jgi:hypothetical protein
LIRIDSFIREWGLRMKIIKTMMLSGCISAFVASSAQAISVPVIGTFRADVGKSTLSLSMHGCGKVVTKAFGHTITLYSDGTFQQAIDLNGDTVSDVSTSGIWEEPREGEISMLYDGDISEGAAGAGAWGEVFRTFEGSLREQCKDISVNVLAATMSVKKLSMKINKKRNQASMSSEIDAYAKGVGSGTGKFSGKVNASGDFLIEG